jgi:hypothetical protein
MVDDIFMVRRGSRNPWSGIPTSPFVALARLIKGIIRFPESLLYQIETEIMPFESWKGEERSKSEMITGGTVSLVSLPTSIVSLPFITGFGEGAWKMLRRRTNQMFAYEIRPEKHPSIDQVHQPGALRQFFENIQHIASSDHPEVEITLVGHSMGAIVVNKILQAFPKIKFDRISYLGAAASIEDFMDTVPPYLDRYPDTTFYSFSLRNKDDGGEYNFLLPRGSLLVWIDNYYEPGISVTGRRVGYFKNKDIVSIRPMDGVCCSRMFFVKFTGLKGQPRKHGDFNDNGIFQSILQWANPNEIAQMEAAKEIVLHCPCKP